MYYLRRFLARFLDYSLLYSIFYLIGSKLDIIRLHILIGALVLVVPFIWIFIETIFLTLFGTTPGKSLLGIHLKEKISMRDALKRSAGIWAQVMGCGLPPFSIVCPLIAYYQSKRKDSPFDQNLSYHPVSTIRIAMTSIIAFSLCSSSFVWDRIERQPTSTLAFENSQYENWKLTEDSAFSIHFPKKPELREAELPIPGDQAHLPLTEYKIAHNEHTYSVAYTQLPKKWLSYSDNLILKHAVKHMASKMKDTSIITKAYSQHGPHHAVDYKLMSEGKEILGKMVLVGNHLYKVELSYDSADLERALEQMQLFTQSFVPKG